MDELDKKAEKGLEAFNKEGDLDAVTSKLNGMVDDLLEEEGDSAHASPKSAVSLRWIMIVVGMLMLGWVGYMGFKDGSADTSKKEAPALYAQYFEVLSDPGSAATRSSDIESAKQDDFVRGMQSYEEGNYQEASTLLQESDNVEANVFAAISEMKLDQCDSALKLLTRAKSKDAEASYHDIIQWYTALCHLKVGNTSKAKSIFTELAGTEHYKSKEAAEILKHIE